MIKGIGMAVLVAAAIAWIGVVEVHAQQQPPAAKSELCTKFLGGLTEDQQKQFRKECATENTSVPALGEAAAFLVKPCAPIFGDATLEKSYQEACLRDMTDLYGYYAAMRKRNLALYNWQNGATDDMKLLVWVVVISGLALTAYQLAVSHWAGHALGRLQQNKSLTAAVTAATAMAAAPAPAAPAPAEAAAPAPAAPAVPLAPQITESTSTVEIGLGRIQVTSSVTGIVILVLSIAFLYFYVKDVYPIQQ